MQQYTDFIIKILLALALSGLIGLDREIKGRPAGLRTYMLVCLGSTVIVSTSSLVFGTADSLSRVLTGVLIRRPSDDILVQGFLLIELMCVPLHGPTKVVAPRCHQL